jgi:hypothetical protein
MPEIVRFFGQSAESGANRWGETSRLINLYSQPLGNRRILRTVLGTEDFADPDAIFCREISEVEGRLYLAQQTGLYSVAGDGSATLLGNIGGDETCTISGNNGKIAIVSRGDYYVWDGSVLQTPSAGAFSNFGSVGFFNQYTILTEKDGRRVQWSGVADPLTLGGLDFATAEGDDDNIIRGMAVGGEYWIFGERSIERWGASSLGGIAPIPGARRQIGLRAFKLAASIPDGVFFVGTDNVAYVASGGTLQPVSSAGVNYSLANESPIRCLYYEDDGHKFCCIVFSGRPAWVYDFATQEWHERASGNDLGPWEARAAAKAYGSFFIGTDTGGVKKLTRTNRDGTEEIIRRAISTTLVNGGRRYRVPEVTLTGRVGWAGIDPDQSGTPVLSEGGEPIVDGDGAAIELAGDQGQQDVELIGLRVSKDNGHTWSNYRYRSVGFNGEYDRVVRWRGLGQFRQMTLELTMSREVEFSVDSAVEVRVA